MNSASPIKGIHTCLAEKEMGIPSHKDLKSAIEGLVVQNIAQDAFSAVEIIIQTDTLERKKITRFRDFLAVMQRNSTSLWDLFQRVKLWESVRPKQASYPDSDLNHQTVLLDQKGVVARIYGLTSDALIHPDKYIEIFFEGKQTGSLYLHHFLSMSHFQLFNGHLFGIGLSLDTKKEDCKGCFPTEKLNLYEWDQTGKVVRTLSLADLAENEGYSIVANEDYFILCVGTFMRPDLSSKILVVDFKIPSHQIFHLEISADDQKITSLALIGNRVIIGSHKERQTPEYDFKTPVDPKISLFNLLIGKIEKDYPTAHKEGRISHLIAYGEQAFFLAHQEGDTPDELCCMDLLTGSQKHILNIPSNTDLGEMVRFSITGHLLTVCYPSDYRTNWLRQIRAVVDLKSGVLVRKVEYQRYPQTTMSFDSGILLIPNIFQNSIKLYVENFYSPNTDAQGEILMRDNSPIGCFQKVFGDFK